MFRHPKTDLMARKTDCPEGLSPIIGNEPRVLILGSFPSVISLERSGYYANPRNQFWKIMEAVCGIPETAGYQERIRFLKENHIALWDVVGGCSRTGSADASLKNIQTNNIAGILAEHPGIQCIVLNGRTAERLFLQAFREDPVISSRTILGMPSTSPANAGMSLPEKVLKWKEILTYLS